MVEGPKKVLTKERICLKYFIIEKGRIMMIMKMEGRTEEYMDYSEEDDEDKSL